MPSSAQDKNIPITVKAFRKKDNTAYFPSIIYLHMHEIRICPLSHKYIQTQANKQKQVVLSLGLGGKEAI